MNGIGERAGVAALEEVAMALRVRADAYGYETGIDVGRIGHASRLVSKITGYAVQPNKAIVGANAFAHEAGIHQDGMLKHAGTYQIMDPEELGLTMTLPLGKHSGRHVQAGVHGGRAAADRSRVRRGLHPLQDPRRRRRGRDPGRRLRGGCGMTERTTYTIACLSGHGIAPEVMAEASRALTRVSALHGFRSARRTRPSGARPARSRATRCPPPLGVPRSTLRRCSSRWLPIPHSPTSSPSSTSAPASIVSPSASTAPSRCSARSRTPRSSGRSPVGSTSPARAARASRRSAETCRGARRSPGKPQDTMAWKPRSSR